jgi:hypothetical protein
LWLSCVVDLVASLEVAVWKISKNEFSIGVKLKQAVQKTA